MKKLIVLIENYAIGGANKYSEDLINSIEEAYGEIELWGNPEALVSISRERIPVRTKFKSISIFNISEKIKSQPRILRIFLRLFLMPVGLLLNFCSLVKLCFSLNHAQPKRVLVCNGGYPASLYLVCSLFFIRKSFNPTMTIVSTPTRKNLSFMNSFWKTFDKLVQANASSIIVNSQAIKDDLVNQYDFTPELISIIRNGVSDSQQSSRTQGDTICIGFVSRLETAKGVRELLEAYKKLLLSHRNIKLLIAGDGSLNQEVTQFAKENPSVSYIGHFSGDISKLLTTIDIFVLPSYQEGLPYSVIEACMASCSIVASRVGGIPEIITDQLSGLLIPPNNPNALYHALNELVSNPTKRIEFARNARAVYLEKFTLVKMKEIAKFLA